MNTIIKIFIPSSFGDFPAFSMRFCVMPSVGELLSIGWSMLEPKWHWNLRSVFCLKMIGLSMVASAINVMADISVDALQSMLIIDVVAEELTVEEMKRIQTELGIKKGSMLDLKMANEGIRKLYLEGKFQKILVRGLKRGDGLLLEIDGTRVRKLRRITFQGVDEDVLEVAKRGLQIEEGRPSDMSPFVELRDRILREYRRRGFYKAEVMVMVNDVAGGAEADVNVVLKTDVAVLVSDIQVKGGSEVENELLRTMVPIKNGDVLSEDKINSGVERINRYFRENQYPTSRVETSDIEVAPDNASAEVKFLVKIEERYQISFSGNTVFEDEVLRNMISRDVLSQVDATSKIVQQLTEKYRLVGYHFCTVDVNTEKSEKEKLNLVKFVIYEGYKVMVDGIHINGADVLGRQMVEGLFYEGAPGILKRRVYWEEGIKVAVENLRRRIREMGFLNGMVSHPKSVFSEDKKGVELVFDVDLGSRVYVVRIEYKGVYHFSSSMLEKWLGVYPGEPVNMQQLEEGRKRILDEYRKEGFVDVKIQEGTENEFIVISSNRNECVVKIQIVEGSQYFVGRVDVSGNQKTRDFVVLREMKLKEGDKFNPELIERSEEEISMLGLFSRVELVSAASPLNANVKDINVVVVENKPGLGELGLGGVYEEPRFRLRTFGGLSYRNLGGLNHTASVRGQLVLPFGGDDPGIPGTSIVPFYEYSLILGFRAPYLLDIPVIFSTQVGLDGFEVSTVGPRIQRRARIENKIEKRLSRSLTGVFRWFRLERTATENLSDSSVKVDVIGSIGPGLMLDFRDDEFNPTKGSYHSVDIELAQSWLASQKSFAMGTFRNSFYFPLLSPFQLAIFLGAGYAESLDSAPLPTARLTHSLSLGGQGTIRGFSVRQFSPGESSLRAGFFNVRSELSAELFADVGFALFLDSGQIIPISPNESAYRHDGVGLGFRYKTPVGPVVVDFAYGLGPDNSGHSVKFYFTVGTI